MFRRRRHAAGLVIALGVSLAFFAPADAQTALFCDGQEATIVGTPDDDVIQGTNGPDVIISKEGNDTIRALGGDDIVCSGKGDDVIYGGAGFDIIYAAQGNDEIYAANGRDRTDREDTRGARMFGGAGNDTIHGTNRWDRMQGGLGDDTLLGYEGRDWIRAGGNDDTIDGGKSIDDVHGGSGGDRISVTAGDIVRGGIGFDTCQVFQGEPEKLLSCRRAPVPEALRVNPVGNDVVRIFRELDAAHEYLSGQPQVVDPDLYFEELGGAQTLGFMADRGYAKEPRRPGDGRSVDVNVQGWSSPNYVQLYVVETRREEGRRMLDEDGATRWEDLGWHQPTRTWVVGMHRTNGRWRIAERIAFGRNGGIWGTLGGFSPRTIPAVNTTRTMSTGTVTAPDKSEVSWESHSYVNAATGDHCLEIRIPGSTRQVTCIVAATAALIRGDGAAWAPGTIRGRQLGYVIGWGPNPQGKVEMFFGEESLQNVQLAPAAGLGAFGVVSSTWLEGIVVRPTGLRQAGARFLGSYVCGEWNEAGGTDATVLGKYSKTNDRKATRQELEKFILQNVYDWYAAPELTISREKPASTFRFEDLPANPTWFQVTASDWDEGYKGIGQKWATALAQDGQGWYIADARFRQFCA